MPTSTTPKRCTGCGHKLCATNTSGLCRTCYLTIPARDRSGSFGEFQLHPSHLLTATARQAMTDHARRAALTVCELAHDADDARRLLTSLGLVVPA